MAHRMAPRDAAPAAEPVRRVAVCLPPPHGPRLAAALRDRFGIPVEVHPPGAPPPGADAYLVLPADADAARALAPGDRVGVLTGAPPAPDLARRLAGLTVLSGALPGAAVAWLADRVALAAPLVWEEAAPTPDPAPALAWEEPGPAPAPPPAGPVALAVYGAGGGVGKTTAAVCFATLAAERAATGLVELDEAQGGLLTYFDRAPQAGLDSLGPADWQDADRLVAALERIAVPVRPRLTVLPMLGTAQGWAVETDAALAPLFAWAAERWAVTVYDCPADLRRPGVLAALQAATRIVWCVEPQEIAVHNALAQLRLLEGLDAGLVAKAALVVTKTPRARRAGLEPGRLAEALGLPLLGAIPDDPDRYHAAIARHRPPDDPAWRAAWAALALPGWDAPAAPTGARPPGRRWRFWRWRAASRRSEGSA